MINIAIIENNKIYRESLKTVLNQIDDFNVVYSSEGLTEGAALPDEYKIDVMLMDYIIIRRGIKSFRDKKIISISDFDELYAEENLQAKGITAVIFKNSGKKEIENKIRKAYKNE